MKKLLVLALASLSLSLGACSSQDNGKEYWLNTPDEVLVINNDRYSFNYIRNSYLTDNNARYRISYTVYDYGVVLVEAMRNDADFYNSKHFYGLKYTFYYENPTWRVIIE